MRPVRIVWVDFDLIFFGLIVVVGKPMGDVQKTDVFQTHDWGKRDVGGVLVDNHQRVSRINKALQRKGLRTWFDEEKMKGNIRDQMRKGIDDSTGIIVYITERYIEKVSGNKADDNCKMEFDYASLTKTAKCMLAVVMEQTCQDPRVWKSIGFVLGNHLYFDFSNPQFWNNDAFFNSKIDELYDRILTVIGKPLGVAEPVAEPVASLPSQPPPPPVLLSKFLQTLNLTKYASALVAEGAESVDDILLLSEKDLIDIVGMRLLEARRLLQGVKERGAEEEKKEEVRVVSYFW